MQFKIITSIDDPFFKSAMNLYDAKFDIGLSEYEPIFKQSLKNEHTKDDYIFLVGIKQVYLY